MTPPTEAEARAYQLGWAAGWAAKDKEPLDVYLRWEGEYEQVHVSAVFGSLEAALAAHEGHEPQWRHDGDYWRCDWRREAVPPVWGDITYKNIFHPVIDGVATLRSGQMVSVEAGITSVVEAVLPDDYVPDFGTPARFCDFVLERISVVGR